MKKDCKNQINEENYFFIEFTAETSNSDYHSYYAQHIFKGIYLAFNLNIIDTVKYFECVLSNELYNNEAVKSIIKAYKMLLSNEYDIQIEQKE